MIARHTAAEANGFSRPSCPRSGKEGGFRPVGRGSTPNSPPRATVLLLRRSHFPRADPARRSVTVAYFVEEGIWNKRIVRPCQAFI